MKKKYLIIIILLSFVIGLILFVVIKFNKDNTKNIKNNKVSLSNETYIEAPSKDILEKLEKAKTLKPYESVDNIKLCDYKEDCMRDVLKNCINGYGLFLKNDKFNILKSNGVINNNVCTFYILDLDQKEKLLYCKVDIKKIDDNLLDEIFKNGMYSEKLISEFGCVYEKN